MNKSVLRFVLSLKIRRLRQKKGLSLKDLAEASGLSHSYLNEIEKGKKYPKVEKLIGLASALGVSIDELISAKMGRELHPLLEFLESDLATNLPLSAFGIGEQDVYDLMSHAPEKFTSFLMTMAELAKSYDISVDDLNKAALRAYLEVNNNYFPILEELSASFSRQLFEKLGDEPFQKWASVLTQKLYDDHGVEIDEKALGQKQPTLGLRSVYKAGPKKTLFLNSELDYKQKVFALVKELGAQFLVSQDSTKSRNPLGQQFPDLLLEYQTVYFAGAVLLPENELVHDLKHFFSFAQFNTSAFMELIEKYPVPAEILMGRLTQILPHHFNFQQLFFLRCNENTRKAPQRYFITQELHLGQLHHPHGISLREHYCRRWITTELLGQLKIEGEGPLLGGQISQMGEEGKPYFCLSLAKKRTTDLDVNCCFTLGVALDETFHQQVNFSTDPNLERKIVGRTCERCGIQDCQEREANPSIYERELQHKAKVQAIQSLLDS